MQLRVLLILAANALLTTAVVGISDNRNVSRSNIADNVEVQENRGGWVNPEDLSSMPQCIAYQDNGRWLSAMTQCTSKRCTRHFGWICTHHQWLTELSCLTTTFTPDLVSGYLPYCARSILAKEQLYRWIRQVTGRTWLAQVGDVNDLLNFSPASLTRGYTSTDVVLKAPSSLTLSVSAGTTESFGNILASCTFTSHEQHTGNQARPWEYFEPSHSMMSLDSVTVGYDFTGYYIRGGSYLDRSCFCNTFALDTSQSQFFNKSGLDWTRMVMWMSATCGVAAVPDGSLRDLMTTEFSYIPMRDWQWPGCYDDIPEEIIELKDTCTRAACSSDLEGYCEIEQAVERACVCKAINYDTCGGSCHSFETRIDYIKWLHKLCGDSPHWNGLPRKWEQLTMPTASDVIPWQWSLYPVIGTKISRPTEILPAASDTCPASGWSIGSFILVNLAAFLALCVRQQAKNCCAYHGQGTLKRYSHPTIWIVVGVAMAAVHLLTNLINALLIRMTPGYEGVPMVSLALFWNTMPRIYWLPFVIRLRQISKDKVWSPTLALLISEGIVLLPSIYYTTYSVGYGLYHGFYWGFMGRLNHLPAAQLMYVGAMLFVCAFAVAFVSLNRISRSDTRSSTRPLLSSANTGWGSMTYGTTSDVRGPPNPTLGGLQWEVYRISGLSLIMFWCTSWLFWLGFIGLGDERYCPPMLGVLTFIWVLGEIVKASIWVMMTKNAKE